MDHGGDERLSINYYDTYHGHFVYMSTRNNLCREFVLSCLLLFMLQPFRVDLYSPLR